MANKIKKAVGICIGTLAAWTFAVKPRVWNKPDLSEIRRYDYAQRGFKGADGKIPENSMAAIKAAIEHGYGLDLDVRLTRDGVPVIFADARLERMTGNEGSVENSVMHELEELKLGDSEERIPTLEDALKEINGQVPVILNIHTEEDNYNVISDQVCEIVDGYEGVFAIESIDVRVLRWFRKQRGEYIRGQISDFNHRSGSSFMNLLLDVLTGCLLMNFLTAPDYVSTNIDTRNNPSLWLCRLVYRVPRMDRVVRSLEDYELVKTDGSTVVFDEIEP
ncbi:MAG: glycerophosphodiester phosphodiesterase family protein [Bilifractor sp.]